MCEPVTIAAATAAVAGAAIKAQSEIAAGTAQANALRANAFLAESAAGDSTLRGQVSAQRKLLEAGTLTSRQKTQYAGAGVDTQSGSPLDVLSTTAGLSELDARIIENNAAREAWGYKTQAGDFKRRARDVEAAAHTRAIGTILGGVANGAMTAYPMLKIGGPAAQAAQAWQSDSMTGGVEQT